MNISMNDCWDKVKEVFASELASGEYTTLTLEVASPGTFNWHLYIAKYGHAATFESFMLALDAMKRLKESIINPPEIPTVNVEQKL